MRVSWPQTAAAPPAVPSPACPAVPWPSTAPSLWSRARPPAPASRPQFERALSAAAGADAPAQTSWPPRHPTTWEETHTHKKNIHLKCLKCLHGRPGSWLFISHNPNSNKYEFISTHFPDNIPKWLKDYFIYSRLLNQHKNPTSQVLNTLRFDCINMSITALFRTRASLSHSLMAVPSLLVDRYNGRTFD